MRHVAALPALSLLAGSACGLLLLEPPFAVVSIALTVSLGLAAWAIVRGRSRALAVAVACGFFAGGALVSAVEWQRAWRPTLRVAFEELARIQRADAVRAGRRTPLDDEAFAIVEGTLRADASISEAGASLSVEVDHIGQEGLEGLEGPEREGFSRAAGPEREGSSRAAGSEREDVSQAEGPEREGSSRARAAERDGFSRAAGSEREGFSRAASGGILVTVVGALAVARLDDWRAGRRVRMPVTLRRPSRYLDPGVPDHERELAWRGTTLVGTVKSGALVELTAHGGWWSEGLAAARAFARRAIARHVAPWSARSGAIVAAIVIGDRSRLDDDVRRALQEAGTYHVIAISGGNIAILAGLLVGAFRLAGWLGRGAMLSAMATVVVYAQFVGGGASVDRATLTAVVYFGARAVDQRSPPLNTLAVVAALLVATSPLSIVDPAFLLTFGATLGILTVTPAFETDAIARPLAILRALFVASVAAEVLLMPIGALLFSRITVAGLALNFLAIPLMGVAQIAGMALVIAALVWDPLAAALGWLAHAGAYGLVWSADLVRFAPAVTWRVAPPPALACGAYYAALTLGWILWWRHVLVSGSGEAAIARRMRWTSAAIAGVAALWIAIDPKTLVAARGDGRLHVTVLDVGQGDAAFVVFPRGSTLLVDAGGLGFSSAFDIGDRVVAPVVRDAGFRRIDRLALSHGDPDHIGGALSIVREFRPREVWEGIPVPRSDALTRLRVEAQAQGARWSNVYAGDQITIDGVEVVARHPERADWERQKVRNDDSLVLELRWRDVSIVLTGDIGRVPEQALATAIPPARLRVVKVPHHGSLTSSTPSFVDALHPTIAVVSAGRNNHFGHPVPEVLERYEAAGARVFRTDRDGAVTIDSDGYSFDVQTFVEQMQPRRLEDTMKTSSTPGNHEDAKARR